MRPPLTKVAECFTLLVIWICLMMLFGIFSEHFLTVRTLGILANRIPVLSVIAAGMTLVLIIGGIDLSVGSVLGLGGAVLGVAMVDWHWPFWGAVGLCVGVGVTAGTLNGMISVFLGIP